MSTQNHHELRLLGSCRELNHVTVFIISHYDHFRISMVSPPNFIFLIFSPDRPPPPLLSYLTWKWSSVVRREIELHSNFWGRRDFGRLFSGPPSAAAPGPYFSSCSSSPAATGEISKVAVHDAYKWKMGLGARERGKGGPRGNSLSPYRPTTTVRLSKKLS